MDRRNESSERRDSRPDIDGTHQAALLIDFDNVTMGIRSNLGQELRTLLNSDVIRGKVAVQRAYADWRRYPQYIVPLSEASIDLIFAPAYGSSKKNATDIRLAIDALELVFVRPEIRTFILMSGDSDFSSLVLKLKEYGKYVIGVGIQESSSDLLVQNCDEYYSFSALTGLSKAGDQPTEVHDPWVLVGKAVAKMVERGDTMRSDRLKQVMIEIDPAFNEREQGFNKFNRFVVDAASRGLISIQKMENGQYGVAPASATKAEKPDRAEKQEVRPRSRSRRRGERRPAEPPAAKADAEEEKTRRARPKLTMKSGLDLLQRSLEKLLEGDAPSVRDSDVKRKMLEYDPAFDEGELGFNKFSKFLQAAEEDGSIQLTRGPQGNFHVSLPKTPAKRTRGAPKQPDREAEGEKAEPERSQAEGTVQRLARFLFGERRTREEEGEAAGAEGKSFEDAAAEPERTPAAAKPQPRRERRDARGPGDGRHDAAPVDSRAVEGSGRRGAAERGEHRRPRGDTRGGKAGQRGRGGPGRQRGEGRRREERRVTGQPDKVERSEAVVGESASATPSTDNVGQPAARAAEAVSESRSERSQERGVSRAEAADERVAEKPEATVEGKDSTERKSGPSPAPLPGAPRGTIRGRWGRTGRYRPAGAPPPILEGQTATHAGTEAAAGGEAAETAGTDVEGPLAAAAEPAPASEASRDGEPVSEAKPGGGDAGAQEPTVAVSPHSEAESSASAGGGANAGLVDHLTGYRGVGRRTAESLVEAFGAEIFRVLDEEPDRVREILPDHRAQRVLEERRRELNAGAE